MPKGVILGDQFRFYHYPISFQPIPGKTYGDAPFAVTAAASSGLSVTFSIVSGPATVSGSTVTITGAGPVTVRALQAGNDTYHPASKDQTFTVQKATPVVTWNTPAPVFKSFAKAIFLEKFNNAYSLQARLIRCGKGITCS